MTTVDEQVWATAFAELMMRLRSRYLTLKVTEEEWDLAMEEWSEKLQPYGVGILEHSLNEAAKRSPTFFPTLESVTAIAYQAYQSEQSSKAIRNRERLLPGITPDRRTAVTELLRLCKQTSEMPLEPVIGKPGEDNYERLWGILVALGAVYGMPQSEVEGDEDSDDPNKRFSFTKVFLSIWRRERLHPHRIASRLGQIPTHFAKWPTYGLFEEFIRGTIKHIPEEYQHPPERGEKGNVA